VQIFSPNTNQEFHVQKIAMPKLRNLLVANIVLLLSVDKNVLSQAFRPGVWTGQKSTELPLPADGYQVYFVGELHGIEQNTDFQTQYLKLLQAKVGLRDVAIEERSVFNREAQAFIDGKLEALPPSLCLRSALLASIRSVNANLKRDQKIRLHLIDIDSPASNIYRHIALIQARIGETRVPLPPQFDLNSQGIEMVTQLKHRTTDSSIQSELRTIEFSIRAYQQGFEVDLGPPKGSPYLDSREEAVASNLIDLLRAGKVPNVLVLYGIDHVSRSARKDGGPNRDQTFLPTALRLQRAGIRGYSQPGHLPNVR
jgi:hypothetical protein